MQARAKHRPDEDAEREARIANEIVVDCYNETECALGWYYYLEAKLKFPFEATCIASVPESPLRVGEEVQASSMAGEELCRSEMKVLIKYQGQSLAVPIRQLRCRARSRATQQAIADWHYWVHRGYEL